MHSSTIAIGLIMVLAGLGGMFTFGRAAAAAGLAATPKVDWIIGGAGCAALVMGVAVLLG